METKALTRPAARCKLRVTLTAGPAAVAAARGEVRAAIRAWNVPVASSLAAQLTSELVTNAVSHGAGQAIELVVSCAYSQLQVDVYDTPPAGALQVGAPSGTGARPGPMLLAGLATSWGHHRTPAGNVAYFTLMF